MSFNRRPHDNRPNFIASAVSALCIASVRIVFAILSVAAATVNANGQSAQVSGMITSVEDESPVVGATVRLVGSERGAVARADGSFAIRNVAAGEYVLSISSIGFASLDTVITLRAGDSIHLAFSLEPAEHEGEEVVVTGTRTQRSIDDVPVRVEAVPQEEVEEKILMAPSNVSMLLNESTGMRVQTTSPTTATANLRIQGLPGRYTQVLTDGIPNVGGLAAGFGLTELPPLNLRQVEIIKGAASALYGADAIAGVVNFITKDPRPELEVSALVNVTSQKGFDLAAYAGQQFGDAGFTVMASRNTQPRFDVDGDGFADVTEVERYTIYPKLQYAFSDAANAELAMGFISDDRLGGYAIASRDAIGAKEPYLEHVKSRRLNASATLDWVLADGQTLTIKGAGLDLKRESTYGNSPFDAEQTSLFSEAVYSIELPSQSLLFGAAYSADRFTVLKSWVGMRPLNRDYSYSTPGLFVQQEVRLFDEVTTLASARVDFHNSFGTFFTPRVSFMYRPNDALTLRVGGGTGFKAPTIFIEEAEESGFEGIGLDSYAEAERAQNLTFDVNWKTSIGDVLGFNANAAAYVTRVQHALVFLPLSVAMDAPLLIGNADGDLVSRGGEVSTKFNYEDFKLSLGYTYLFATQEDRGERYELALNPRHSLGVVLMWESEDAGAKVGFETYWTGVQRLEDHPSRTTSPSYVIMGLLAEKAFGPVRLFINFENFTDTRQTKYESIIIGNPQIGRVRALPIYAPLEGRVINGGVRFVL